MWGNVAGWIIAGVLFVCIMGGAYVVHVTVNKTSAPTRFGTDEKNLASLVLDVSPGTIVPMASPGDAGPMYRKTIDDVLANMPKYEKFIERGTLADAKSLAGVAAILEATQLSTASILMQKPATNIGYFDYAAPPDLVAIDLAGRAVERIGLLHNAAGNTKEAQRHFQASFALGAKLFAERVIFMEAFKGIGLMNGGAEMLKLLALKEKDDKRVETIESFVAGTKDMTSQLEKMWKVVNAVGGTGQADRLVARHAGDIFYFTDADHMKERMWRVEATLKLGRFKFNVGGQEGRVADQTAAEYLLRDLEKDSDLAVRTAADAALKLTLQDFRLIK